MDKEVLVGSGRAGLAGAEENTGHRGLEVAVPVKGSWLLRAHSIPHSILHSIPFSIPPGPLGVGEGRLYYHESDSDSRGRASPLGRPNVLISQIRVDF